MKKKTIKISQNWKLKLLSDGERLIPIAMEKAGNNEQKELTYDDLFEMAFDSIDNINKALMEIITAVERLQQESSK